MTSLIQSLQKGLIDRDELERQMREVRDIADQALTDSLSRFRDLLRETNPLQLLCQINLADALRRNVLSTEGHYGSDGALEAASGLVTEMTGDVVDALIAEYPFGTTEAFVEADQLVRRLAVASHDSFTARDVSVQDPLAEVAAQMRLESALDRMSGYIPHLRAIAGVLDHELGDDWENRFGFRPGLVVEMSDAYGEFLNQRFDFVVNSDEFAERISAADGAPDEQRRGWVWAQHCLLGGPDPEVSIYEVLDQMLPGRPGIELALASLTTAVGSQSTMEGVGEDLRVRAAPIVRCGSHSVWPRPGDFLHAFPHWLSTVGLQDADWGRTKINGARKAASESLMVGALKRIFGEESAFAGAYFVNASGSRVECDALVIYRDLVLICEAKAGHVHPDSRSGDLEWLRTNFERLIVEAMSQIAVRYQAISTRPDSWFTTDGTPIHLPINPVVVGISASLEHVDPLIRRRAEVLASRPDECPVWNCSTADFLMCADILRRPDEFVAYASARAAIDGAPEIRVITETDALCEFLAGTLSAQVPEQGTLHVIGGNTDVLNQYYTREYEQDSLPPAKYFPEAVLTALSMVSDNWVDAVETVHKAEPKAHRALVKALRRGPEREPRLLTGWKVGSAYTVVVAGLVGQDRQAPPRTLVVGLEDGDVSSCSWIPERVASHVS